MKSLVQSTPAETIPSHQALAWIQTALGWAILIIGVYTAFFTVRMVVRTYAPGMFIDEWIIAEDVAAAHGAIPIHRLWMQHNEHRFPVVRAVSYADLFLFGGREVFALLVDNAFQVLHLLIFASLLWSFAPANGRFRITAAGLLLFFLFQPIQVENLTWGFQVQCTAVACCASLAFVLAVLSAKAQRNRGWFLAGMITAAWTAECSLSNGLLVWPVLSLLGFALRFRRRHQLILAVIGIAAIGIYFLGYSAPTQHPGQAMRHPIALAKFVVTELATTWDGSLPNASEWPSVSESFTILALALSIAGALRCFLLNPRGSTRVEMFCYANIVFVLLSALMTAFGRLTLGPIQAMSSRYQAFALVFWACIAILVLLWCEKHASWRWPLIVQTSLLVLLLAAPARFASFELYAKGRQAGLIQAYTTLSRGTNDPIILKYIFPDPATVQRWYATLRLYRLGPDPREFGGAEPKFVRSAPSPTLLRGYNVASSTSCFGFLDEATPVEGSPGRFRFRGWAWDRLAKTLPSQVVLALPDGSIAGTARLNVPRPDVRRAVAEVTADGTGWETELAVVPGTVLRTFAILNDQKTACPLANEFTTP